MSSLVNWQRWRATLDPSPIAQATLVCLPYAGGSAAVFRNWPPRLPVDVELIAAQLPGRANRLSERPYRRVSEVVPLLAQALLPLLDTPFVLFGYSLGAILAFEVTRWLRRNAQRSPAHLIVGARRAPHLPPEDGPYHVLDDAAFVSALRTLNGTPQELLDDPSFLELVLPTLRADFEMSETYEYLPDRSLVCPITALGGTSDTSTGSEDLEAWRQHTTGAVAVRMIEGDHFFLHSNEQDVIRHVTACLSV